MLIPFTGTRCFGGGYSEKSSGVSYSHGPAGHDLIIIILLDRIVNVDV
jgi:hypothetical protein